MYLMKPGWKTERMGLTPWGEVSGDTVLKIIEEIGRVCYKSEDKITPESAPKFVKARLSGMIPHTALLDHLHITARYVCDRGVSHEWLRHKLTEILPSGHWQDIDDFTPMAVCQESTRYCNYMKSGGVCFIVPPWVNIPEGEYALGDYPSFYKDLSYTDRLWYRSKMHSEYTYLSLLREGWTPQMARGDLSIAVKTEFVVTCSLTEWRHVMRLRTDKAAHPQMVEIMRPQLEEFKTKLPIIFDDINW